MTRMNLACNGVDGFLRVVCDRENNELKLVGEEEDPSVIRASGASTLLHVIPRLSFFSDDGRGTKTGLAKNPIKKPEGPVE